ncbi:hypothetical protein NWP22_12490 [Anabaenopsis tanganyikae CS-531]|uniref:Uncharacterized protein n=1 Tax=Anabaenopsis tanganyikae CS-531 TaxID=2785304 RepID=A0ABT6KFN5_9CYAN|nr:hypothetical protein [Anabaenopsis tanganyikae]MDH6106676.1 hypothetical protein [Anabaenopsis tanganyikae CS-531]
MSKPSNSDNTHIEKVNTKDLSSLIDKKIDEINFDRAEEYVQRLQKKYVYQSNHENAQIIIIGRILPGLTQLAQIGSGGSRATGQFQLNQAHRNTWAFELLY